MGFHIFESNDGRLFHHVAQVARERELACLAFAQRGLDEQDFAAHACPRQACHHTGIIVALVDVAVERRFAKEVFKLCGRDLFVGQLAVDGFLERHLAKRLVYLLLQLAHAALTGIMLYDLLYGSLVKL